MLFAEHIAALVIDADTVVKDASLLVGDDGTIRYAGERIDAPAGCERLNAASCAVLPGFVNAHTHLWQQTIMGQRDDLALLPWCDLVLSPAIQALYAEKDPLRRARLAYLLAAVGACEMLHGGVTAFLDMDLNYAQESMFFAARDVGVRGYFGVELADRFLPDENGLRRDLAEIERLLSQFGETCVLTPSEPNLCSDEALGKIALLAQKTGALVQIHVNETAREREQAISERKAEELFLLESFGLLSSRFSAVHGVHLSEAEIALCKKYGVTIVYNPKSNMKLASGVCPIQKLRAAGVNIALATDGPASNDRLDLFEEMRAGALLQKLSAGDPSAMCARDAFSMATKGGAELLHLNAGTLSVGKRADFLVLPLDKPHLAGAKRDIVSAVVHCAGKGDVRDAFVDGKPVLRDYRVTGVDESALSAELLRIMDERTEET